MSDKEVFSDELIRIIIEHTAHIDSNGSVWGNDTECWSDYKLLIAIIRKELQYSLDKAIQKARQSTAQAIFDEFDKLGFQGGGYDILKKKHLGNPEAKGDDDDG